MEGLSRAEGYIRRELAQTVNLRNTPQIRFIADDSIAYGVGMSRRIDEVIAMDESRHVADEEEAFPVQVAKVRKIAVSGKEKGNLN